MNHLLILNYCNIPYYIHKAHTLEHWPSLASAGASENIWLRLRLKVKQEISGIVLHFGSETTSLLTCK